MAKGAKQKSNVVLMASGSKHARPNEPKMKTKIGPPPSYFSKVEVEEWEWAVKMMTEAGTVFEAARATIVTFALAAGRRRDLHLYVKETGVMVDDGMGRDEANKALAKIKQEDGTILRALAELGLTPASTGKVAAPADAKKNKFADF
jgi:P27 family predicted phage terminase small subunit